MVTNELARLQVSYEEYLCMKTLLLLSTGGWIYNWPLKMKVVNIYMGSESLFSKMIKSLV